MLLKLKLTRILEAPMAKTISTCKLTISHRTRSRMFLRFLGLITLLAVLSMPAFSQTDYSDSWLDDSNPDSLYVVGAGVTDNDYSADAIAVETTLTSPNGRTVTGEADDYGSARVEVALPWDWDDLGDYYVHTIHQPLCWGNWDGSMIYEVRSGGHYYWHWNPDYFRCIERRETSLLSKAGASRASYDFTSQNFCCCTYHIIPNCHVRCGPPEVSRVQVSACAAHIVRVEPWFEVYGRTVCVSSGVLFRDADAGAPPCTEEQY